jgi:uncharacterized glyoxalase superfamily protein PhnB
MERLMKPTPPGWPRISASIFYDDAASAIDFLSEAFGFQVRLKVEGERGRIEHSELTYGDGLVMVGQSGGSSQHPEALPMVSPRQTEGRNTQSLCVFVDDVDAHYARSRAAGAVIADEPATQDYGEDYWADRSYRAIDPEGHQWWFMQRMRGPGAD